MREFDSYDQYRYDDYTVFGRISSTEEHLVEDARTQQPPTEKTQYVKRNSKRKRTKKNGIITLTVMITILCFSAILFAADILSNRSGIAEYAALFSHGKSSANPTYYAVYASYSEDMGISYKNANAVRTEGGAGYVLKDAGKHYVILNVYADRSDAQKVAKRQANYGIYEISFPPFTAKKGSPLSSAEKYKDLFDDAYRTLYTAANELAEKKYGNEDFKRALMLKKEEIVAKENAYAESIRGREDSACIEYKVIFAEIRSAFENLIEESNQLISDARYYSTMILHHYALFAKKHFS